VKPGACCWPRSTRGGAHRTGPSQSSLSPSAPTRGVLEEPALGARCDRVFFVGLAWEQAVFFVSVPRRLPGSERYSTEPVHGGEHDRKGFAGRRTRNGTSAEVVEHLIGGVVSGDEGDAGTAAAVGATEVEPIDSDRHIAETTGPGQVRARQAGVQQSMAEVAGGSAHHRVHVVRREGEVADLDVR